MRRSLRPTRVSLLSWCRRTLAPVLLGFLGSVTLMGQTPASAASASGAASAPGAGAFTAASTAGEAASRAHAMLTRLCDDAGGRLTGSPADRRAIELLMAELRVLGLEPERDPFRMPGWERRDDRVDLLSPFGRRLRVAALGYSQPHAPFEAELIELRDGRATDYPTDDVAGKVGLINSGTPLQTAEFVRIAAQRRLGAILFINREGGGQLLARTGSFVGAPLPPPDLFDHAGGRKLAASSA